MMNVIEDKTKSNEAAIGIGAMIVFIALILVAAVASAVIIQTGEKLQQSAQSTGDDTQDEISGKIKVTDVFISDTNSYRLLFQSMPGSDPIAETDITFQFICGTDVNALDATAAVLMDTGVADGGANAGNIMPGIPYAIDTTTGTADCGATAMGAGTQVQLWTHIVRGGSSYELLEIEQVTAGVSVL